MTIEEKAAHFYRTNVETIENFTKAFFSTISERNRALLVTEFLEIHTGKVCKQTLDDLFSYLDEYTKRYYL